MAKNISMKKICLSVVGLFLAFFSGFAQSTSDSSYEPRPLKVEEVNFVSSYYTQDGSHSSVTGGIGTQKLNDLANVIDLKMVGYDYKKRKHTVTLEAGIDHYTSASSDRVDSKANSSASSQDTRFYPSIAWAVENEKKGTEIGLSVSYSKEFDYRSFGIGIHGSKKSKDGNTELGIKAMTYLDKVSLVYPNELIPASTNSGASSHGESRYPQEARNSYSAALSLSHVVNKNLQVMLLADVIKQTGYLSLPFHRVYFYTGKVAVENLPNSRLKFPIGARANYFIGDKIIIRSFYRFYKDDWNLTSNTIDLETSVKVTPFFSVTPFYRFYNQTAIDYFAAYKAHLLADTYYTSNYDLSKFNSNFFGAGFRYVPVKGVLGIQKLAMVELRYGHYQRSNDLSSDIISINLKMK